MSAVMNEEKMTNPKFDQQASQDLLNSVVAQREQAFNAIAQLQAALAAKDRELVELKKTKDKKPK